MLDLYLSDFESSVVELSGLPALVTTLVSALSMCSSFLLAIHFVNGAQF